MDRRKFWAYVTIFGTLWGGLELTLGTFLHVLHVPKTGLIMVTLSVILLMAQHRIFPARGSTLAVGIIAAAIKGLSPGGIIAGPIFGILTEALVIELCLFLGGRNVLASMLAGGLAVLWCQLQALFKIWIYYGQDFIDGLAKVITKFFQIEWTAALGWTLVGTFLAIVMGLGAVAACMGWRTGSRILTTLNAHKSMHEEGEAFGQGAEPPSALCRRVAPSVPHDATAAYAPTPDAGLSPATPQHPQNPQHQSQVPNAPDLSHIVFARKSKHDPQDNAQIIATRLYVLPLAILTLVMQFSGEIQFALAALAIWMLTLAMAARRVLRTIWWPKFWALTFVISVLCGVLLSWGFDGSWNWQLGLEATIRMMVRGVYVFSLVNWFTRCIRSEEFISIWSKIHLPQLGQALVDAYTLLPRWLDRLNAMIQTRPKSWRSLLPYIRECFYTCLLEAVQDADGNPPRG